MNVPLKEIQTLYKIYDKKHEDTCSYDKKTQEECHRQASKQTITTILYNWVEHE